MKLFAQETVSSLKPGDVLGLVGELGAGKTTFVQHLAKALGVKSRVNSPTFLVMRVYKTEEPKNGRTKERDRSSQQKSRIYTLEPRTLTLVHIDAYRLKDSRDLETLGATEYIGAPNTITVIEWADRVKSALPKHTRWIHLFHGEKQGERVVVLK